MSQKISPEEKLKLQNAVDLKRTTVIRELDKLNRKRNDKITLLKSLNQEADETRKALVTLDTQYKHGMETLYGLNDELKQIEKL
jgi:hypothetical protein